MAQKRVVAEFAYEGKDESQLTFQEGDVIIVLEEDETGWWTGRLEKDNREGYFPSTYIKLIENNPETTSKPVARPPPPPPSSSSSRPPPKPTNKYHGLAENNVQINVSLPASQKTKTDNNDNGGGAASPLGENYYSGEVLNLKFNPNAMTRFGIAAHYMSFASSIASIFLGIAGMSWGGSDSSDALDVNKSFCTLSGVYCFVLGFIMYPWELIYGEARKSTRFPFRSALYFCIGVVPFITLATSLAGLMWLVTSIYDFMAFLKKEEYEKEVKNEFGSYKSNLSKYITFSYYIKGIQTWCTELRQQSKTKKYFFLFVFIIFNLAFICERAVYYSDFVTKTNNDIQSDIDNNIDNALIATYQKNGNTYLTSWYPIAKMFGSLLDINAAFIVLPVCRSVIRFLYNMSTDQRTSARCCSVFLSFMPLDKAIQWHKVMAGLIVVGAVIHTWAHFMHYGQVPETYKTTFGPTVWVSGIIIILCMQLLYCTSFEAVRRGKFELFWYSHHLFVIFFIATLFHGKNSINPNYWKWFIGPGALYLFERIFREYRAKQPIGVVSVTHLNNRYAKVFCLELEKTGPISHFSEGQYLFLNAPIITKWQWHPFTISSPPDMKTLTLHIRNMGDGTWTDRLQSFFRAMAPTKAYTELFHREAHRLIPQTTGPDGNNLICVDGPMAAPTQHLGEYCTAIIVGAGIGVTPVRATLQSIVYYRFKRGIGRSYPDHAYCVWIVNYQQIDAYRFMIRTLKEAEDELYNMRKKNPTQMNEKILQFHIFVTSVPENPGFNLKDIEHDNTRDAELAIWGPHYDDVAEKENVGIQTIDKVGAPFTEVDIYKVLKQPKPQPTQIGDIIVHNGRPNWDEFFPAVQQAHRGDRIGVMFCGPDIVAKELKKSCGKYTDLKNKTIFLLHKENF